MKWLKKVKAFAIKVWANIELIVRIVLAVLISIVAIRLFSGKSNRFEYKKKVEAAKEKNKELNKKADDIVAEAESTSERVEQSTEEIRNNKESRDKKADDIFGGS